MADKAKLIENYKKLEAIKHELERRLGETKLERYHPHPKQALLHNSDAKIRIALCGNRWGKTEFLIAEALATARGRQDWDGRIRRPPPTKTLLVFPTFSAINEYVLPKFEKLEPDNYLLPGRQGLRYAHQGIVSSRHYIDGSMIAFGSYVQDVQQFQGRDWDMVGLDETCPKEIFDVLMMRLIDRKGRIVMTLTPENMGAAWIFDDLYTKAETDPTIFQVTGSSYDNPNIPKEEIEAMEKRLSPEEREAKIYGKFKHLMGRVFPEYDPDVHCFDSNAKIEPGWPKGIIIDPHDRKPFAMAWFAVNPQNDILFFEEWPPDDFLDHKTPHSFEEYVKIIHAIEEGIPGGAASIQWRLIDPNFGPARKAISGRSVVEEFAEYSLYFDSNIDDDIQTGHIGLRDRLSYDKTQPLSALNRPKMFFRRGLINFHRAFLNYTYDTRKMEMEKGVTERAKEKYKDFIDCARYVDRFDPQWFDQAAFFSQEFRAIERLRSARIG